MKRTRLRLPLGLACALLCAASPLLAASATPPLGAAQSYAVLAATTVTNTGSTTITGDLGVSPGTAVTGFGPGVVVSGGIHTNDNSAIAARTALGAAYDNLLAQPCTADLTGQDLGGMVLTSGVYCFSSSAQLTGLLTLDAQGSASPIFIFKIGTSLTTASGSSVVMTGGASLCDTFWQVGSSATLGTGSSFAGNILANVSITLTTGARVTGRTLARNGAVTLDSNAVTATCLTVGPPACGTITLAPPTLPAGTVNAAFAQTLTATGGRAPYAFDVISGTLPPGVTLAPAGVLAGTPTTAGTYNFTVRATDADGCTATLAYTIVVAAAPVVCTAITLSPPTLPAGRVAVAYAQTITASGGTAPYTFSLSSGALPAGVTLTAGGILAGTPTSAGTATFTVRATDASGCPGTTDFTLVIAAAPPTPPVCPAIALSPTVFAGGTVGAAYTQTITASGGAAPYSFGVTAGLLPAGLTLTPAGVVSGTPTAAGAASFSIRVTDADGCFSTVPGTITIAAVPPAGCPVLSLSPAALPNGSAGTAYSQTMTASGGVAPYTFAVAGGALPAGITLTTGGVVAGTPAAAGSASVTIRVTDVNGCFAERSFTVAVAAAVPTLPQAFTLLIALSLAGLGWFRLRRRTA